MKINPIYLLITLSTILVFACNNYQDGENKGGEEVQKKERNVAGLGIPRGLITNSPKADNGYIMFNPNNSASSYLMNRQGEILHEWKGFYHSWLTYLKDNGNVIRNVADPDAPVYYAGGMAGRIEELTWEGETIWEFEYATEEHQNHHDLAILPNGNILAIAWERRSAEEVKSVGRKSEYTPGDGLWLDKIIEIEPIKPKGGKIVWEWRFWDHLIQDTDPLLPNFGDPADHPELFDINASAHVSEPMHADTLLRLKKEGNIHRNATIGSEGCDILHSNAINYNAELDQIVLSSPHINEIFIIDHSTSTEEAAGHTGGRYGNGGDFLYRWGNPKNYSRGDSTDQELFNQHDVKWIENGLQGESHLLLYNNARPEGPDSMNYSSIYEIVTPFTEDGKYPLRDDGTYGPDGPVWSYTASDTVSFYSPFTSGAQRLENGNTFILCGAPGRSFEVSNEGEIVWDYWNPYKGQIREPNGDMINDGPFLYWQFRSTFIPKDHPALAGKELKPLSPQPEVYIHDAGTE